MKKYLFVALLATIGLGGCSKSDSPSMQINQKEVKLKFDGSFDFKIDNASSVEWSSSDEFVGKVGSDGKFKAAHIGEATVTGKVSGNTVSAKVIVEPYVTDIVEPTVEFGASKATVKSFEKRSLFFENSDGIIYTGQGNKEKQVFYVFGNSKLSSSSLIFNTNFTDIGSILAKFYGERHQVLGTDSGTIFFQSKDKKTIIGISVGSSLGLNATYIPESSSAKAAIKKQNGGNVNSSVINNMSKILNK
ncbi:Uncharacterised protein [Sphingobacterium multivorum]|uniref:hypothetical protein n=1 Tax=Sphingobacterium multivorum TaxID=28454 RepID=UPI000E0613EB|nr:hypothetical protein [Sphingobacterium multivorum]QQT44890.1 hypothetical protein I6J00_24875 [Sphingobacterium multivorum]SUJ18280.1 Uncharacterised protein [Sphingobacterium multivorum]